MRFAPDLLLGAFLEVEEERFDGKGIRALYDSPDYPLPRRRTAPMPAASIKDAGTTKLHCSLASDLLRAIRTASSAYLHNAREFSGFPGPPYFRVFQHYRPKADIPLTLTRKHTARGVPRIDAPALSLARRWRTQNFTRGAQYMFGRAGDGQQPLVIAAPSDEL